MSYATRSAGSGLWRRPPPGSGSSRPSPDRRRRARRRRGGRRPPAFLLLRETTNGRIPTLDWLGLGRMSAVKTALDFKKYHISIALKSCGSFWGDYERPVSG